MPAHLVDFGTYGYNPASAPVGTGRKSLCRGWARHFRVPARAGLWFTGRGHYRHCGKGLLVFRRNVETNVARIAGVNIPTNKRVIIALSTFTASARNSLRKSSKR